MIRLLIDECLSTALVPIARQRGHHADHVSHLGLSGRQDWNLMPVIEAGDFAFVTNNRLDFLRLFARRSLHNGLIVIVPNTARRLQCDLFARALDHVETLPDLVNQLLEIEANGTINVSPLVFLE